MIAPLFLTFVVLMATIVIALAACYMNGRFTAGLLGSLLLWFIYVGTLGYAGILKSTTMRPPGVLFILLPIIVFLAIFIARSAATTRIALAFPIWALLLTQTFRVGVELFIHQLWIAGLAPRMLTFSGANVDIYVGATAPVIAWLSTRGRWGLKLALIWNWLGLIALSNIVTRAVLTAPGPLNRIHTEVPNQMIGTFPYMFIPAFFVPLAVVLHVLAIRAIRNRLAL